MQAHKKDTPVFRAAPHAGTREGRKSPTSDNTASDIFFAGVFVLMMAALLGFSLYYASQP